MRGVQRSERVMQEVEGIIPADAGSTNFGVFGLDGVQDHPSGCGEHATQPSVRKTVEGSSPRMRGAHLLFRRLILCVGIIPADAGSTAHGRCERRDEQDHPRGCGEHGPVMIHMTPGYGSSPRMRGARDSKTALAQSVGIIPADAGSTSSHHPGSPAHADHPRGCGEHSVFQMRGLPSRGSSPRMRGAHICRGT